MRPLGSNTFVYMREPALGLGGTSTTSGVPSIAHFVRKGQQVISLFPEPKRVRWYLTKSPAFILTSLSQLAASRLAF